MNESSKYSENYLFQNHPAQVIRRWLNDLEYFYYHRAWGGHANDGDNFTAYFKIQNEETLKYLASNLQIDLKTFPKNNPKPYKSQWHSSKDSQNFKQENKELSSF